MLKVPPKKATRRNRYHSHALRPAGLPSKLGISQENSVRKKFFAKVACNQRSV
jgi:hypothetical protein